MSYLPNSEQEEARAKALREEIRIAARDHLCEEIVSGGAWPIVTCGRQATHVLIGYEWDWQRNPYWRCRRCWYKRYLRSRQWERLRERRLRRSGWSCERCHESAGRSAKGNRTGLNLHHLTYERVGRERDEDLIVLCFACHEKEHGIAA